ncbi:hypothetical protein [Rhodococcus sp. Q]|uniref:hypothetical protein n=1 Tax=Rhodococcus sp. Q TaxID=2502252 RepID=UPI0010F4C867|nr:hypothetical protein [Rhodococcus sp. Q]
MNETTEFLAALFGQVGEANVIYDALVATGAVAERAAVTYRFRRCRCAVLHVIEAPNGVILGFPRYKAAPAANLDDSNESGRANNTEDGNRRWRRHAAYFVADLPFEARCDHSRKMLNTNEIRDSIRPGKKGRTVVIEPA